MVVTSRVLKVTLSALMAAPIAAVACTNDYDQFHSPEAVAAGTSGSPATGGSGTGGSGGAIISGGTGPTGGTGGTLPGGSGGVTTGGVGGAGGSTGGSGGSGATGGATTCPAGQKLCSTGCVATDQISTGCGQTTCDPCSLTVLHATPVCDTNTGYCVYQAPNCDPGYGDCNFLLTDGCEAATSGTVLHCGGCESFRICSETNVASADCPNTLCTSTCQLGFGNCTTPAWPQADNGCETDTTASSANCGGCGNVCSPGFSCQNMTCGCTSDTQCKVGTGNPSGTITCNTTSRRCVCAGVTCNAGEACNKNTNFACSCNGGAACGAGSTCCQTPAGCKDLTSDPSSCGACGHACPPGFACSGGQCVCDADSDCNLGSVGVCSGGVCACTAVPDGGAGAGGATDSGTDDADSSGTGGTGTTTTCGAGQRCLPNGSCG